MAPAWCAIPADTIGPAQVDQPAQPEKPVAWSQHSGPITVQVYNDYSYSIQYNGETWLQSGQTALHCGGQWYSTVVALGRMALKRLDTQTTHGQDSLGAFQAYRQNWDAGGTAFQTGIRVYENNPIIVFEESFPNGAADTSVGIDQARLPGWKSSYGYDYRDVLSSFPSFRVSGELQALHYLTYHENHSQVRRGTGLNGFPGGRDGGVPLVLYNDTLQAIVLSPLSRFQSNLQVISAPLDGDLACGVEGLAEKIPPGYRQETILTAGQGINSTMYQWGSMLLQYHGKSRNGPLSDPSVKYLGYWTDNGAYYYYHTAPGENYYQTLADIRAYHRKIGLPIHYYQLDSWWYHKGIQAGVTRWDARKDVFPDGLSSVQALLGTPLVLHNRYWAPDTTYAPAYRFAIEKDRALPLDLSFWQDLLSGVHKNGAIVYEQDWLIDQTNRTNILHSDVDVAQNWLLDMGKAASANDMTIQYCMSLPCDLLQSTEIPAVTQARASDDYHPGNGQWRIAYTSMLDWALGIAPFKDTFWSTTVQPGSPYGKATEPNPELQALMSALSGGPVGPGDGIGYANKALIMKTCQTDGLLLKPDKPITPIDRMFEPNPPDGEVWAASTDVGARKWRYVAAINLRSRFLLHPSDLGSTGTMIAWDSRTSICTPFNNSHPIRLESASRGAHAVRFSYYVIAPLRANGWALIGDTDKFVTLSRQMFSFVSADGMSLIVRGAPGEKVHVNWIAPAPPRSVTIDGRRAMEARDPELPEAVGWRYDGSDQWLTVTLRIPETGTESVEVRS